MLSVDAPHILTTNYDLTLERGSGYPWTSERPFVEETRYSLFRRNRLQNGKRIWHIHGSVAAPKTMVLGFEHYAGTLQAVREVVVNQRQYKGKSFGPLKKQIPLTPGREVATWVELVLTHHLMFLGLTLDFSELPLWWLLTYRARRRNLSGGNLPNTRIVLVTRRERGDRWGRRAARHMQLNALGVEVIQEDCDWPEVYERAFERLEALG